MTTENLYTEQINKAAKHNSFYHYTNLDALAHILSSAKIRLSQLELLNDPVEEQRVDCLKKNKIFVTCFSHNETESIPMWKIYTEGKWGMCLVFEDISFLGERANYLKVETGWGIRHCDVIDTFYCEDVEEMKTIIEPIDGMKKEVPDCLGYVKSKAWEYEDETRVRCYIDVAKGNFSRIFPKDYKDFKEEDPTTYNYPKFKYVYCHIPKEILDNIRIVFNPFMDEMQKEVVKAAVLKYLPDFKKTNFINSELEGKIRL